MLTWEWERVSVIHGFYRRHIWTQTVLYRWGSSANIHLLPGRRLLVSRLLLRGHTLTQAAIAIDVKLLEYQVNLLFREEALTSHPPEKVNFIQDRIFANFSNRRSFCNSRAWWVRRSKQHLEAVRYTRYNVQDTRSLV